MNNQLFGAWRLDRIGIFRTAVNPSLEAAGKTSCFSRSGKYLSDPASFELFCDWTARLVTVGDGVAPIAAERAAAHAHAGGRLAAFVLVALHQIQDASHRGAIETSGGDLIHR